MKLYNKSWFYGYLKSIHFIGTPCIWERERTGFHLKRQKRKVGFNYYRIKEFFFTKEKSKERKREKEAILWKWSKNEYLKCWKLNLIYIVFTDGQVSSLSVCCGHNIFDQNTLLVFLHGVESKRIIKINVNLIRSEIHITSSRIIFLILVVMGRGTIQMSLDTMIKRLGQ